jgi:hypothetical protein
MATTNSVPGMNYPTLKGMLSGTPMASAHQQMINTNTKMAALSGAVGGKKRYRYGGATIPVPQFQMQYTPQSGPGTTPNAQIQTNSQISTQGVANAVYDNLATKKGGKRKYKTRRSTKKRFRKQKKSTRKYRK